jgi:hypothetical protein
VRRQAIELETVADRRRVGGRPNLMKVMRCYFDTMLGVHGVVVARVDHRRSVLAEVDPVVKAHHEGVSVSGVFVSIYPYVAFNITITFFQ